MHVPDGFLAPTVYVPAYVVSAGLWSFGARRAHRALDERTLPQLAVLTALAFALMTVTLPLPGGTSVHFSGVALIAILFGVWPGYLCVSLVLLLQATLLGAGGITALPVNAIAVGLVGSTLATASHRLLLPLHRRTARFVAGWISVVAPAAVLAVVLGLQPALARSSDGAPLFFPFGLDIALPALVLPHCLLGVGEGILTVLVLDLFAKLRGQEPAREGSVPT